VHVQIAFYPPFSATDQPGALSFGTAYNILPIRLPGSKIHTLLEVSMEETVWGFVAGWVVIIWRLDQAPFVWVKLTLYSQFPGVLVV
jgi:hypothetical protein